MERVSPSLVRCLLRGLFTGCVCALIASVEADEPFRFEPVPLLQQESAPVAATPATATPIKSVPLKAVPFIDARTTDDSETTGDRLATLPHYRMNIRLRPDERRVAVEQTVRWTNRGTAPTDKLVFQVVPNYRVSEETAEVATRTLESLRLNPRYSIDREGRRFHLTEASLDGQAITCTFDREHDTHMHVALGRMVAPGESVTVELNYWLDIPDVMGRFGRHKDVTNLLNWYPVVAIYQGAEWQPVPYVPWHQPWYNDAGVYDVRLSLPADHRVVTGGHIVRQTRRQDGLQHMTIRGEGLRDFTIVASRHFEELTANVDGVPIRVQYLPGHRFHAQIALNTAVDSIKTYTQWFGPYPYHEFELTESYFGWNGNESSGVVMIDQRIFDLPKYAQRYIEHLVSHEICHQWWYSAVGTNGYAEPWMDEGLVTWFTRIRMEDKYGVGANVLELPGAGIFQFPNVQYESLVHSGYKSYRSKGGTAGSGGTLDDIGHLHNLISLVYDRGARITGMIEKHMGRDQFFVFMKQLYQTYEFRIITVADFQRELEAFTGESWQAFFQQWYEEPGISDLSIESVDVQRTDDGYSTAARVSVSGPAIDNIDVEFSFPGTTRPFRLATLSEVAEKNEPGVTVQQTSPGDWLVTVVSEEEPSQVEVDPDGFVLESDPHNNQWRQDWDVRVSPVYTPADEASLLQPWQRRSLVAGFGVDADGRLGLRAAAVSSNRYRISPFFAYSASTATRNGDHLSVGIDAQFFNFPSPNWQLLARYEYALLSTLANDPGHQARIALRRVLKYTSSLIYPNLSYIDFYARFGDNFFPDEDNTVNPDPTIQQFDDVQAFGIDFHLDSQLPYWDPDRGFRLDLNYEHGSSAFSNNPDYNRVSGQFGVVQRLSSFDGWLGETKLAGRVSAGYGDDNNGEHFRFGGPGRFRGRNATATEGNAFWLSSLEWRFPVVGDINYRILDNTAGLKSVDAALFYDVGQSFINDQSQGPTDHAVGLGLYWQIPLLSFVERLTVRTEYGYSVTNDTGAFWFGLFRAF